jgi:peptidyl-prolyl cis-trans isomerase A (cyclophilin A)
MDMKRMSRRMALGLAAALCITASAFANTASQVKFQTTLGDFTVEVYPDKAPKTVENFLQYVKDKHYNGTVFHRVMNGFMVQGGGFTPDLNQKPTRDPIPLEAKNGLKNDRGTIAMARTPDPNSATAQFFINVVDNAALNAPSPDGYGYAVFGKVVSGMETIDKIKAAATGSKGMFQNVPVTPILINSATLAK